MNSYKVKIFQLFPVQEPAIMYRFIRKSTSQGVVIILDLEDALWDVTSIKLTDELKARGRKNLTLLAKNHPGLFSHVTAGVRLNRNSSFDFIKDVEALADIARIIHWDSLILTKIENPEDINDCIMQLNKHNISYANLIPIIETVSALQNLLSILSAAENACIKYMVYGHYDYSLDAGYWPFLEHDEADFWQHLVPIVNKIEQNQLSYVHPPFPWTYDDAGLAGIFSRLKGICKQPFGMITVSGRQTSLAARLALGGSFENAGPLKESGSYSYEDLIQSAESTRRIYDQNRRAGVSFALNPENGRFISPHEYLASIRFLEKASDV